MFGKKYPDPAQLADEGLQQVLDAMTRRQRRMDKFVWPCLFVIGLAAGIGLGGAIGYGLGLAMSASSSGGFAGAVLFGAMGMGLAVEASEGASNNIRFDREWKARGFKAEIERRAKLQAEEEERMKTPLDSKARDAFMSGLDQGAKEELKVYRPLRLRKRTTDFSPTRRILH